MLREVIRPFQAWDTAACYAATLDPGAVLDTCRIQRFGDHAERDAYGMEFHSSGRRYTCPLYLFQARTRALEFIPVAEIPEHKAIAV